MRYAPQYTELCYQRKKALYTVRPVTLFRAFFNIAMHSRRKEELLEASEGEDLKEILDSCSRWKKGPVLVFPEVSSSLFLSLRNRNMDY
jgi:hypothetical protein